MLSKSPSQYQILTKLDLAPDNFILTGSQFFRGNGNDIDFFVQDRPGIDSFLHQLGLRVLANNNYKDNQCIRVFRGFGIDIQIVKNDKLKERVQNTFKRKNIFYPTTEQWNMAFDLLSEEVIAVL